LKRAPLFIVAAGVAAYALYIYLYVGVRNLLSILSKADPLYVLLSMSLLMVSSTLHGLSWYMILGGSFRGAPKVVAATVIGLFTSYIAPVGAASEVIRFLIATRALGVNAFIALSTILLHRICITIAPLIAIASILLYAGSGIMAFERATFAALIAVYLSFIVSPNIIALGFMRTRLFERLVRRFGRYIERFTGQDAGWLYEIYRRSVSELLSGWRGLAALAIAIIEWAVLVGSMYSILLALGIERNILYAVFSILLIQILWWILPISFGGSIGVSDLIASIAYQLLGFQADVSASIVLLYRIASLTSLLILLYPSTRSIGLHMRDVRDMYRSS